MLDSISNKDDIGKRHLRLDFTGPCNPATLTGLTL